MEFAKEHVGEHDETLGTTRLHVNDTVVAEGPMRTQVGTSRCAATACAWGATPATRSAATTRSRRPSPGGTIHQVEINVGDDQYVDLEQEALAALARE